MTEKGPELNYKLDCVGTLGYICLCYLSPYLNFSVPLLFSAKSEAKAAAKAAAREEKEKEKEKERMKK